MREGKEEKVVMWVLDSFSTLVSNALDPKESKTAYAAVITTLFDLNTSIIPVAVCSSATTAGALNESKNLLHFILIYFYLRFPAILVNPHIWVRAITCFPPVVDDPVKLKEFIKSLCSNYGIVLSEQLVKDIIASFGGCLLLYEKLLKHSRGDVEKELNNLKETHLTQLRSALNLQKGQVFTIESLERYKLLQAVARGEKIFDKETPEAKYLIAKHGEIQAFLGIHPEKYLVFALPMTEQALKIIAKTPTPPIR
jgi:hypothetical protein